MKLCFMSFSCPDLTLDELIAVAKKYGYDGIEPRVDSKHKHGIEFSASPSFRSECKKKSRDSGIALACVATSCTYANPKTREKMVGDTHKAIDLAADVGAPRIRVFGGALSEGFSREEAIGLLVTSLKSVAGHASERGVTICVETHDHWCDPKHLAEVMCQVAHPCVAVNWDIMHPVHSGQVSVKDAFEALKPWIRHVHCHDGGTRNGNWGLVPIGEGDIDHAEAIRLLKTISYEGVLSGEWIDWEPYDTHLPREAATLRNMLKTE